jgi:hypothetical protein
MNESQKYALVTGASSGIGWQICRELTQRGYALVGVSNQPQALADLKKELETTFSIPVLTFETNLADPDAAQKVFEFCRQKNLEIEVLVNNAGMLIFGNAVEVDFTRAETLLHLHMNTPALLCRLFGEGMKERGRGYVLNVSSISARMPYPTISYYGPSKAFVRAFTRALRTELKPHGVKVTCVLPGATSTALFNDFDVNRKLALRLGVMKRPDFVARKAVSALFRGRAECVPGFINKLTLWFIPLVPHGLIGFIYRRWSKKKG